YRFNGYGYFWGMTAGIAAALAMPVIAPALHPLQGFPVIFGLSLAASIAGSLLTAPEPDHVLERFYRQVRPWGLWGRVRDAVLAADPSFRPNRGAGGDAFNVVVAVAWQMTLVTIPLYMVVRDMKGLGISALILLVTSWVLKRSWYDKLEAQ
ncbi:MAG: sodium:solute symporter, partial [Acidobacteria bacterium]